MKLTLIERQNLVDSRLVYLEDEIKNYKSNEPIVNDNQNIKNLKMVVMRAEELLEAYEAKVEAEEEQLAEETEEIPMFAGTLNGLDEALNLRKGANASN